MGGVIRAIAFVDLDDTLFQTRGKCPPDVAADRLTPLGFTRDGEPLSFATPRQMRFLSWLTETTLFVPVTARSLDALRRVRIRFEAAICAHGGVILDDEGEIDAVWAAEIGGRAEEHRLELNSFADAISAEARRTATPVNVRVLSEGGMPLYVLAKHADADAGALNRVVDGAVPVLPVGWTDHRNGNNVALMPPYLGKRHAVQRLLPALRARHPDAPVLGIGDSLTDAPFMAACDYAMLPTGSQLAREVLRGC
jgi:hydroxymethylpyrimidine pyrophosphatase-like HAD family hydrolase